MKRPSIPSLIPVSAHSADNKIIDVVSKLTDTPEGGQIVVIIQPIWTKALESDMRLAWLKDMIKRGLVVRRLAEMH